MYQCFIRSKKCIFSLVFCLCINLLCNAQSGGLRIVSNEPADMFIFYSTSAGSVASDGANRNSPFVESFLNNVHKNEPLSLMAIDIVSDTYRLTSNRQIPVYESRIKSNKMYSIASNTFNKRYALLIGMSNYRNISKLNSTVNEVQDISIVLRQLGYDVDVKIDLSLAEMERSINDFKRKLASEKESEGFFWFAGHGVQSNGENYLVPVDADIQSEVFLRTRAYHLNTILNGLESIGNKINLVFIDASRDNPFPPNSR